MSQDKFYPLVKCKKYAKSHSRVSNRIFVTQGKNNEYYLTSNNEKALESLLFLQKSRGNTYNKILGTNTTSPQTPNTALPYNRLPAASVFNK